MTWGCTWSVSLSFRTFQTLCKVIETVAESDGEFFVILDTHYLNHGSNRNWF